MPNLPSPDTPSPFRAEVPTEIFVAIENARNYIKKATTIFNTGEEKPIVAQLTGEYLSDPQTPNEVKMEAFRQTVDLIDQEQEIYSNKQIAQTLIDMIRMQPDPHLRIRLAALISSPLQIEDEDNWDSLQNRQKFLARRAAFQTLAADGDASIVYKGWANMLLKGGSDGGVLKLFNALSKYETDLTITPKIEEGIIDETREQQGVEPVEDRVLIFTGELVRLNYCFPSPAKVELFRRETGRFPVISLVRSVGRKFVYFDLPPQIVEEGYRLLSLYRNGELSKDEVYRGLNPLASEFLEKMNPEQRDAYLSGDNVHIRFGTERSKPAEQFASGQGVVSTQLEEQAA